MVAHHSREGTSHVEVVQELQCHHISLGFPKKRLSQMAFSSQQGQEGQAGKGKLIKWCLCECSEQKPVCHGGLRERL